MAQRAQNNGNGSTFRTANDIRKDTWEQALPELQSAFSMLKQVGEIPTLSGGGVVVNGAALAREDWNPEFCRILEKFNGMPLPKMDDPPSAAVVASSVLPKRLLTAVPA